MTAVDSCVSGLGTAGREMVVPKSSLLPSLLALLITTMLSVGLASSPKFTREDKPPATSRLARLDFRVEELGTLVDTYKDIPAEDLDCLGVCVLVPRGVPETVAFVCVSVENEAGPDAKAGFSVVLNGLGGMGRNPAGLERSAFVEAAGVGVAAWRAVTSSDGVSLPAAKSVRLLPADSAEEASAGLGLDSVCDGGFPSD